MRRFLLGVILSCVTMPGWGVPATVDYIFDGDTFAAYVNLDDDVRISVRVRLINVDTPEIHGACAREIEMANAARDKLAEMIPVGTTVELKNIKDDKYLGRIDANVIMADGRDVGNALVQMGLGRPYAGGHRMGWCD